MKILVFGNVGSGKTTILKNLKSEFFFPVIAIDDFRRKYGKGDIKTELIARKNFIAAINSKENQFVECIGVGKVADELFELLKANDEQIICLTLLTPQNVCAERLKGREWNIPFPNDLEKVNSLLERTEKNIESGAISNKWLDIQNIILIEKENIKQEDIENITNDLIKIIQEEAFSNDESNDIQLMLSSEVQKYYSNEYLNYQKKILDRNDKFSNDRMMISKFISQCTITGNLVDVGSGSCQWFHLFEPSINRYYAIESNGDALSLAPSNPKLIKINENIFDPKFDLKKKVKDDISHAFFSFFLSHFSEESIQKLFIKLESIDSLLVIDSFWCDKHKEKYKTKDIKEIRRKISYNEYVALPKRFFEYSDIENIVKPFGFSINKFTAGNYWFVSEIKK